MRIKINPAKLAGNIEAISSKSYAQRIILAAAIADAPTQIICNNLSEDIKSCLAACQGLGAKGDINNKGILISPGKLPDQLQVNCGESGTTARMILPIMAALSLNGGQLNGEGSLLKRPFAPLCLALEANGLKFSGHDLPLDFSGRLKGGLFNIDGNQSSQYISGLMLALPLLDSDSQINLLSPLQSAGYIDMTIEIMRQFKVEGGYQIKGRQQYISPEQIMVEGDWSNASYWLAANIMPKGLNPNSLQKDSAFIKVKDQDIIDAQDIPDLVPALAVYAAQKTTDTKIINIERLRLKESDRIASVKALIEGLGGQIIIDDAMTIKGLGGLKGGEIDSFNDHRIVMAAAIAANFCAEPIIINDAQAVSKSYPAFFADFAKLGGDYYVF